MGTRPALRAIAFWAVGERIILKGNGIGGAIAFWAFGEKGDRISKQSSTKNEMRYS